MITKEQRSKLGRASKRKGARAQTVSAQFWSEALDTNVKSTPRSGAFCNWPGDLLDLGDSILKDFIIERKFGKCVPKKIGQWMEKLKTESHEKMNFLEISRPYQETYIIMNRKQFAKLLCKLQSYRSKK